MLPILGNRKTHSSTNSGINRRGTERSIATREGKRQNAVRASTVMARIPTSDSTIGNYYEVWPASLAKSKNTPSILLGADTGGTGLSSSSSRRIPLRDLGVDDEDDVRGSRAHDVDNRRYMSPVEGRGGMDKLKLSDTVPIPRDNDGRFPEQILPPRSSPISSSSQQHLLHHGGNRSSTTTVPSSPSPGVVAHSSLHNTGPKLLQTIQALISTGLASVSLRFPQFDNPKEAPSYVTAPSTRIEDHFDVFYKEEASYTTPFASETFSKKEDSFAAARLDVFLQAADTVCSHFKTYSPILKWIFAEHHRFIHFSVRLLMQERKGLEGERGVLVKETTDLHDYVANLERENADLKRKLEASLGTYDEFQEAAENAKKAEGDALYKVHVADHLLETQEREKATLAKHILKVEREVKDLKEAAEIPAKNILTMKSQLLIKDDLIKKMGELMERSGRDNTNLRRQLLIAQQGNERRSSELPSVMARNLRQLEESLHAATKRERQLNDALLRLSIEAHQSKSELGILHAVGTTPETYFDSKTSTVLTPRVRLHSTLLSDVDSSGGKLMEAVTRLEKQSTTIKNLEAHVTCVAHLRNLSLSDMRKHIKYDKLPLVVPRAHEVIRKWFPGMGVDNAMVPIYLRCDGRLKNLRFTLKMTHACIRTFRSSHTFGDIGASVGASVCMADRLHLMLHSRYTEDAPSMAYSLHEALQLHDLDPEVFLFREILEGRVDEEVYLAQVRMVEEVRDMMIEKTKRNKELTMSKLVICRSLAKFFLPQAEEDVGRLFTAMRMDQPGDGVDVYKLFNDIIVRPSHFTSAVFDLLTIDRQRYLDAVEGELLENPAVSSPDGVTPLAVASAFLAIDPEVPPEVLHVRMCRLFTPHPLPLSKLEGLPTADQYGELGVTAPLAPLLREIRRGEYKRYSRQPVVLEKPPPVLDDNGYVVGNLDQTLTLEATLALASVSLSGAETQEPQEQQE